MKMTRVNMEMVGLGVTLLFVATPALAAPYLGLDYASGIGLPSVDIRTIAVSIIRDFLGLMGIYLVVRIMWGGFLMMTHGGKEDKRAEAMALITNSVIGMIVVMTSSSLAAFVINAIANATGINV